MRSRFGGLGLGVALAGLLALGGCGGGGGGTFDGLGATLITGGANKTEGMNPADFEKRPACPPVEIRQGTESILLFEPGKPRDPATLQYQVSVQRVARECSQSGDQIIARVGAAGRVASGPKGASGDVKVPVRIAVTNGDQVVYSKFHLVVVKVGAPDYAANWSQVDEQVAIPAGVSRDVTIYVGLDEAGEKGQPKPARKKKG